MSIMLQTGYAAGAVGATNEGVEHEALLTCSQTPDLLRTLWTDSRLCESACGRQHRGL
jgi:hypothetical protein